MHQIKTQKIGEVWQRDASCCCEKRVICVGHEWKFAGVAENARKFYLKFKTTKEKSMELFKQY